MELSKTPNQLVADLLNEQEALRDNDEKLILNVWCKQMNLTKEMMLDMKFEFFVKKFIARQLYDMESISRARRKLQETIPMLRGKTWEARHKKEQAIREHFKEVA